MFELRKKRSWVEIFGELLATCRTPTKKTHVMYRLSSSYKLTKKYLRIAIQRGMIEKQGNTYLTTHLGLEWLEGLETLWQMLHEKDFPQPFKVHV